MSMLTPTSSTYEDRLVISHLAAEANLPCLTGSPASGQNPKFLCSACPHLCAAIAPMQGLCHQVKSRAAHQLCFIVSVLAAFLHSSAIDWRTSDWNVGVVVASLSSSGRLDLGTDDVCGQFVGIVDRSHGQNCVENSYQLTCHSNHGMLAFQWILDSVGVVLVNASEL